MNNKFWRVFFELSLFPNLKSKACPEPRRRIGNLKWVGIVTIGVAFAICGAVAQAQDGKTTIRIAIPNASICCLHLFAAQQWKVFEDNGLDVEIIQMRPQVANAAMVVGEIHYFAGVGPNSVAATLRGLPSRAVWFASDQLIYSLLARPEFKTLKELRSKRLAVGGLGDTTEVSLRIGLEAAGENPKDFVILGVGNPNIMSALESGSVEAALLNPPLLYYAKRKGFRDLLDIGAHVKMPLGGLTTMISTIQSRPAELRRLIRSIQVAKRSMLQSKEKSVDVMMRYLKVNRETGQDTFADYQKTVSGNGVPSREGIEQIVKSLQLLGQFGGRKVAFEDVADARIAREVAKELGYKVE
ncbi:MAG TPA: ABC transporter substrate-binding protein [Candidatus Binatia bacterium]|nr:ABC transporter substrate-binding protein [Candidatus Binatia bacterium]